MTGEGPPPGHGPGFSPAVLVLGEAAGGGGDVARVDAGPGEEFGTGAGAGRLADGEVGDGQVLLPRGEQGAGDGGAETSLGVVVFGDHDATRGGPGGRGEGSGVDRLDGVAVDDPGGDALGGQGRRGIQAFVQSDAGADQGHVVVVGGAEHLGAADGEPLPGRV